MVSSKVISQVLPREQILRIQDRQINNIIVKYDQAARTIQNAWKNYKIIVKYDQAARTIQNAWKNYKQQNDIKLQREIEIIIRKEIAARIIQDWWRKMK